MAPEAKSELSALIRKGSESWGDAKIKAVVTTILRRSKASCFLVSQFQAWSEQVRSKRGQAIVEKSWIKQQ